MKNVLVIGGNGYIGSRLIYDLHTKYNITSLDVCWFNKPYAINIVQDYKTLSQDDINKYDVIILLAGHSSVKMCNGPLDSSWNNNVNNFVNLVKKLNKNQLLIYASSGSVYGLSSKCSREDDPILFKPINNYDLTKFSLDTQAQTFINKGYNIVGLRFGTVNGWSPNTREELMINSMTKKSLFEGEMFVNNSDVKRPILGIQDISMAIDNIITRPVTGIYNLASFVDTVDNISKQVGGYFNCEIIKTPDQKGIYDFDMDTTKFKETFNFTFTATIDSILNELSVNIDKTSFSDRNKFIDYE
ncbi:SDR family oxidoreductase [bacterium]|nr:SDR family oxidoreductase [Candidatus Elulimicrobium humile]